MALINIKSQKDEETGWLFEVEVMDFGEKKNFRVTLKKDYFKKLTARIHSNPTNLVRYAFEFLLQREAKESILSQFDIAEIPNYFPEFEEEIKKDF